MLLFLIILECFNEIFYRTKDKCVCMCLNASPGILSCLVFTDLNQTPVSFLLYMLEICDIYYCLLQHLF